MIVLGLTGSIGMGKSTVAKMLKLLGIPVHDSDAAVHEAIALDGAGFEAVAKAFPQAVQGGVIDRKILGGIVFNDAAKLKYLEEILHPIAKSSQEMFLNEARTRGESVAVLEIPLLFETGADERADYVLVVSAPPDVQRERVMERPGMTSEKFAAILEKQMPDVEKRVRADYVIDTGQGYIKTFFQLYKILKNLSPRMDTN